MERNARSLKRKWLALAVVCAGGLLPATCMLRARSAIIDGSKAFLANTLGNPSNFTFLAPGENQG